MRICRFKIGTRTSFGVTDGSNLYDLTATSSPFYDLNQAYSFALSRGEDLVAVLKEAMGKAKKIPYQEEALLIPLVPREIWAAGVTYLRSREARETETSIKGVYDRVYTAERPELFIKDSGLRVRGPREEIFVRSDSKWSVPEPELSVVLDAGCRIIGYTIGNDVSSRDIEGENSLYLPQAKIYRGSSAIGPVITTADEIPDPHRLQIQMHIIREGEVTFSGSISTGQMKRRIEELIEFLKRDNVMGTFTILMTGTGIVPPEDFSLAAGDIVNIEIEKVGTLTNPVGSLAQ